jgi:hypothetical protein
MKEADLGIADVQIVPDRTDEERDDRSIDVGEDVDKRQDPDSKPSTAG